MLFANINVQAEKGEYTEALKSGVSEYSELWSFAKDNFPDDIELVDEDNIIPVETFTSVERVRDDRAISIEFFIPILNSENIFYPHIDIIANASTSKTGKPVWAWTVSESIKYSVGTDNNLTLSIDFPVGSDQYIIINGIESFRRIDIYEMAFRTDPRFETYSSSGYVYNNSLKTLFLKSQQRSSIENIKLYYDNPAPAATTTATPNPVPAPTDENTDSASPTDSTTTTNQD